jgi:hypothetical protein
MDGIKKLHKQLDTDLATIIKHFGKDSAEVKRITPTIKDMQTFLDGVQDPASLTLPGDWNPLSDVGDLLHQVNPSQAPVPCRYNGLCVMMNRTDCTAVGGDPDGLPCNAAS